MLRSELENIVKSLGLKSEVGNRLNTIMSIWREHKSNKYLINGAYYSTVVLGKSDIIELNKPFEKLLEVLIKNNIQIQDVYLTDNGAISEIVLYIRKDSLSYNEKGTDFEIETNIPTKVYGQKDYNSIIPTELGFTSNEYSSKDILFDIELSKIEKDKIYENLNDIFDNFQLVEDRMAWLLSYIEAHDEPRVVNFVVENNKIDTKFLIQEILNNEETFSDVPKLIKLYTTIFKYLSTLKCSNIDSRIDSNHVGYLPGYIIESLTIFKNILENWEFSYETGQNILEHISLDLHIDTYANRLKLWVNTKDPSNYYFDSWDIVELILGYFTFDLKFITYLFENKWLELEHIDPDYMIQFISNEVDSIKDFPDHIKIIKSLKYIISLMLKEYTLDKNKDVLERILKSSVKRNYDYLNILIPFIDNFKGFDFKIADGEIMKYLSEKDELKQVLLSDSEFISYLISVKKEEYLPQNVTDIFLF